MKRVANRLLDKLLLYVADGKDRPKRMLGLACSSCARNNFDKQI